MVSFSCEACGDVLTKKKLDAHRGYCRGASFTCLDCMTHFRGNDYKSHTFCMTEAQKYEGAPARDRSKRKSVTIVEPLQITRQPYVEDVPDMGDGAVAVVSAPPHAPSPPPSAPPSQPTNPVNVFDFLVNDDTPNASRMSLPASKEQMCMVDHAPPIFKSATPSPQEQEVEKFNDKGFSYGAEPVPANSNAFRTPAPKAVTYVAPKETKSTDKKRKRQVEDLDLTQARRPSQELEDDMEIDGQELAAPVLHSGLTGGLNRLLSSSKFPPSPDYSGSSGADIITISPVKRTRAPGSTVSGAGTTSVGASGIKVEKARGRNATRGQLVRVRKAARRTSDESRPRKHHRSHRSTRAETDEPAERPRRPVRAIEYHQHHQTQRSLSPDGPTTSANGQLVVYGGHAAEMFLSFVTKGPESGSGCSVNKALKRYHRERGEHGADKAEAEKELWKSLRLKRNERGEVVVLLSDRTT